MNLTRAQLNKKYGITEYAWKNRHDELIEYLKEYMDITEHESDTHRFISKVISSDNTRGDYYFRILTKDSCPIYVLEERKYIYNTHIIPTTSYRDTELDKKESSLTLKGLI